MAITIGTIAIIDIISAIIAIIAIIGIKPFITFYLMIISSKPNIMSIKSSIFLWIKDIF